MPIVNSNGVNLNYEVAGEGQAVVILHGVNGSTQDWSAQMKGLSSDYRVIALDMRGHGKSDAPEQESEYSIPIFTDDVLQLLDQLDIQKCCLVGHAIGGIIALQFALDHGDRLSGLVLVDTTSEPTGGNPEYAKQRQKIDEVALSEGIEAAFDYAVTQNPMFKQRFQENPELMELVKQRITRTSVPGYVYSPRTIMKWQPVTSRLSEIKVPTLILLGEGNKLYAEPSKVMEKGIPDSKLVTMPGAGHNIQEDEPEIFNQNLLNFLKSI